MPLTGIAEAAYEKGDYSGSLIAYIFAGELGYKVGSTNAAWLLDQHKIPSADYSRIFTVNTTEGNRYTLAHPLWNRAANQGNVDARVKLGDYYYNELLGQNIHNSSQNKEKAAEYYKLAAEHEFSAIAMYAFKLNNRWNLAFMYETGLGVDKDFYLAKRMYDLCLTTNPAGYIAVDAALLKLYLKWTWSWLIGEKVQDLFAPPPSLDGPVKPKEEDLYSMDVEQSGLFSENLLLLFLIGVATLMFYYRQKIGAQSPQNRHQLPTDEELEPLLNDTPSPSSEHKSQD